jgi:hypothetical protein
MLRLLKVIFGVLVRSFRARGDLLLENLALRQQLAVLARRHPQPRFSNGDDFSGLCCVASGPGGESR